MSMTEIAEEFDDTPLVATEADRTKLPASTDGVWLDDPGVEDFERPEIVMQHYVPRAHRLLPELERRRSSHEDAMIDLRRANREAGPQSWRLRGSVYLIAMLLACLALTGGAYASIAAFKPGTAGALAALGIALNIVGLAHFAGGWGRWVIGARSWPRRIFIGLLAIGASCEIFALIYFAGLGWTYAAPIPLIFMASGASVAIIASALSAWPHPELARLIRREREARRDYNTVCKRILHEIGNARRVFDQEAAMLENTAAPLRRSAAE
jgi:hypothetical protein